MAYSLEEKFKQKSLKVGFDKEHRKKIHFNISKYDVAVERGKQQYSQLELAKKRAAAIKHKVLEDLDKYLTIFEMNFTANGGQVIWARTGEEAVKEILKILKERNVQKLVKSKSMTTEEIDFNEIIEQSDIEVLETDLGEYIVQIDNDKPYHIVTPAMHKSKEDIAALFHEKFGTPENSTPEDLTKFVRDLLRIKFVEADAGITGSNFIIADSGSIALTENEGNALLSTSFPKIHIAIAGIEKLIPSIHDLDLFWPLLATHGTGQNMTVYNTILSGPKKADERDGPQEMFVVLLDNGRTDMLNDIDVRRSLSCIRCGACLNACPVYKNIGGHTYNTTYSGPIGSVISPHLRGMKDYKHLSFASSLCGKCTEVCPVKINLHELLLLNRKKSVQQGYTKIADRMTMWGWKKVMLNRRYMDMGTAGLKNTAMKLAFRNVWGPRRTLPEMQKKNFKKLWKERKP